MGDQRGGSDQANGDHTRHFAYGFAGMMTKERTAYDVQYGVLSTLVNAGQDTVIGSLGLLSSAAIKSSYARVQAAGLN